jgi:hypothetical protein
MVLFGSRDDAGHTYGDTWQLSLSGPPTWARLELPTAPSPRSHATLVYDSIRQRLVLFGGMDAGGTPLRDTWFLPLAEGASWMLADSSGALPRARWAAAAAFDAEHDRVVVLNGTYDPCGEPTDIVLWDDWEMHSADPVPEPLALASVERHPQSVSLAWHARSSSGFTGAVARRTADTPWRTMAPVTQGADGTVRFEDTSVSPGAHYDYRVTWSVGPAARTTEAVSADVPALHFALQHGPNPSLVGIRVSFSLPDAAPAELAVLDVTGRTVAAQAVGDLGPGDHDLQLIGPGRLHPGHYWIRLKRGSQARTTGIVLLH